MTYNPSQEPQPEPRPPVYAAPPGPVEKLPGPAQANLAFLVGVIAFLTLSIIAELSNWGFALTSIAGEAGLALAAIMFCVLGNYNFKETFSLHRASLLVLFFCFLAGLAGQFAVRFPAALNQWVMEIFGPFPLEDLIPNPKNDLERYLLFFVIVIVAPFCEEILNRGFVLAGYRRLSFGKSIFFVGLLFGLFHLYPFRFAYTFLLGMALAYLVLVTRSIYTAIATHLGFNFIGGLSPWITDWLKNVDRNLVEGDSRMNLETVIATIPLSLVGAAVFLLLLRAVTKRAAKQRPELELGYFGLARRIRADLPPGFPAGGPYYGPDRQYEYGRYGYQPAQFPLPPGAPGPGNRPASPLYNWNYPPAPRPVLGGMARTLWQLSFVALFLLYAFTSLTEITRRISNSRETVPQPSPNTALRLDNASLHSEKALLTWNNGFRVSGG